MISLLKKLLVLSVMIAAIAYVFWPFEFKIISPRLGQPSIIQPHQTFAVELATSMPFFQPEWQISLESADRYIPLSILSVQGFLKQRQLIVKANLAGQGLREIEKLDLVVSAKSFFTEKKITQIRKSAVFIRQQLAEDFDVVHMADPVIFGVTKNYVAKMQILVDEINLLSPDLVIFSGDLGKGGRWNQFEEFIDWMEKIDVPIILGPGNHAYDGWGGYLEIIGKPNHVVHFGEWCIITANSGHGRDQWTVSQYNWLSQQVNQCDDGKIIVHTHHPLFYKRNIRVRVNEFVELLKSKNTPLMLNGHWHLDAVFDESGERLEEVPHGIKFISTTSAGDGPRNYFNKPEKAIFNGYRLIRFKDGKITSYSYDRDIDGKDDLESSSPWLSAISYQQGNQLKLINSHNLPLTLHPQVEHRENIVCLQNRQKPQQSIRKINHWLHKFKINMPAHSIRTYDLRSGAYC